MRKAGRDLKVTLTRRDIIQMEKNILETINYHVGGKVILIKYYIQAIKNTNSKYEYGF